MPRVPDTAALPRVGADPSVQDLPPAALRALIEHDDPDARRVGLVRLAERQDAEEDGFAWAGVLPEALDASPEAALAQARLHLRFRLGALPGWRAAREAPVRIAWLAAELASRPEAVREEPAGELLYQAVRAIGAADARDPEAFVRELAARNDAVLREEAFRVAREALHAALLAPARARPLIADLAIGAGGVGGAVRELAEPWAALDPLPRHRVLPLLDGGCPEEAVDVAARHGHPDLLRDVAADPGRPPRARRRALEAYGDLAERGDVPGLLRVAAADPLLLAGPALRCLRRMHRRGRFPADGDVPAIVGLALADHGIGADGFAAVVFSSRRAVVRELTAAAGADDASWPRRLELLVALDAQGAGELGIGDAVAASARSAEDPRPFLRALRALRHVPAEQAVIDLLPRAPREALDALEAIGGPRTVAALRDGLGADGEAVEHLRPFASRALEVLWHLTEDAGERRSLLARLDPRSVPPRIADDLGGPDAAELAFLRADLDPDAPAGALCRIARNGDASTVPAVADLLLRVVSDLAAAWRSGPEPSVPDAARAAVRDLGARLFRRGAVRPRCLLDADGPESAGNALLASVALDLADRPGLTATELAILLGLLRGVPYRRTKARVHPLLRHRDPDVRKHVIALLADDAEDLSASLVPLASGDDARTVRQAVRALAEARATWAAPVIAACLDHPNMNVKKTAADALARAGAPRPCRSSCSGWALMTTPASASPWPGRCGPCSATRTPPRSSRRPTTPPPNEPVTSSSGPSPSRPVRSRRWPRRGRRPARPSSPPPPNVPRRRTPTCTRSRPGAGTRRPHAVSFARTTPRRRPIPACGPCSRASSTCPARCASLCGCARRPGRTRRPRRSPATPYGWPRRFPAAPTRPNGSARSTSSCARSRSSRRANGSPSSDGSGRCRWPVPGSCCSARAGPSSRAPTSIAPSTPRRTARTRGWPRRPSSARRSPCPPRPRPRRAHANASTP
ncbi:hypothetical protein ACFQHO_06155 [Actinomadura yumaensis]|uniref:hypothetical protein n=1 Tax=Actinomadura yumaensis TaxID=111807 RepID=UPI00362140E6